MSAEVGDEQVEVEISGRSLMCLDKSLYVLWRANSANNASSKSGVTPLIAMRRIMEKTLKHGRSKRAGSQAWETLQKVAST